MLNETNAIGGLFSGLEARSTLEPAAVSFACACPMCAAMALAGQEGASTGEFGTSPSDNAYGFVAQTPTMGGGDVAALMSGSKWSSTDSSAKTIVTYSFANPQQSTYYYTSNTEFTASLSGFTEADKTLTRSLLASIEAVCNVDFVEVPDNAAECGVLRYGYSTQPNAMNATGYAFFPSSSAMGGDIWIGANQATAQWDFYRPNLILHETLHAIGLKHPFSTGAVLSTEENIIPNTVMSYSPVAGGTSGYMSKYPNEPMPLDVAALQAMYGAANTNAGNTVYDLSSSDFQGNFNAVWDAGGKDLFDASKIGHGVKIDLAPDALSDVGLKVTATAKPASGGTISASYTNTVSVTAATVIEDAVGTSYADKLSGNDAANLLAGGAGNDVLEGRGGNDQIDGGAGLDTAVIAASRAGYSISKTSSGYAVSGGATGVDALSGVERLSFNDAHIALDVDGNAGAVAKLLGVVLGCSYAHDAGLLGLGIGALDSGMGTQTLAQYALEARLGGASSNAAVVDLLFANLAGLKPSADQAAPFVQLLDSGAYTQGGLTLAASEHELNLLNIDFTGMAATGLEYIG